MLENNQFDIAKYKWKVPELFSAEFKNKVENKIFPYINVKPISFSSQITLVIKIAMIILISCFVINKISYFINNAFFSFIVGSIYTCILFLAVICFIIWIIKINMRIKEQNKEIKKNVIPVLFSDYGCFSYENPTFEALEKLKNLFVIYLRGGVRSIDDYFVGEYKGINVEIFELFLPGVCYTVNNQTLNHGGMGVLLRMPLNVCYNGVTCLVQKCFINKSNKKLINKYVISHEKLSYGNVYFELNNNFDIYSSDITETDSILTEKFVSGLIDIHYENETNEVDISIEDGYINLLILNNNSSDKFEIGSAYSIDSFRKIVIQILEYLVIAEKLKSMMEIDN